MSIKDKRYSLKDILTTSWLLYRENFKQILIIVLLVYVPIEIVLSFVSLGLDQGWSGMRLFLRLSQAFELFFGVIATIAIARLIEAKINEKAVNLRLAFDNFWSVWPRTIFTSVLAGLVIIGFTLLLIVPGVIWSGYYLFILPVVILRGLSGGAALAYSKKLVIGQWWRVLNIFVMMGLITLVVMVLVCLPLWFLPEYFLFEIIAGVLGDIVFAFYTVASVVFFLNTDYLFAEKASG